MAAVGVRFSLSLPTATRAMSWTIGVWLVVWPVVAFRRDLDDRCGVPGLHEPSSRSCMSYGLIPANARPWFPMSFSTGWALTTNLTTLLLTILVVADTSFRFDRIAGRMAGGTVATTVDAMVHGTTHKAVFLPDKKAAKKAKTAARDPRAARSLQHRRCRRSRSGAASDRSPASRLRIRSFLAPLCESPAGLGPCPSRRPASLQPPHRSSGFFASALATLDSGFLDLAELVVRRRDDARGFPP